MDETKTFGIVDESSSSETVNEVHDQSDISPNNNPNLSVATSGGAKAINSTEQSKAVLKDLGNSVIQSEATSLVVENSVALLNEPKEASKNSENPKDNESSNVAIVISSKPLCADYRSGSDTECDSESDSSSSTSTSTASSSESDCESDGSNNSSAIANKSGKAGKRITGDISLNDLPPIENLKISVPEDACVEVGTITSVVDVLVIVESYKGSAALDVDTVLFLDHGKKTLGKVFDILGPITEPVYAIRFNSPEQIKDLNIEKGIKVYFAPKTEHTSFVFMSEVLKNKGSDASWKDNTEAPPEFQDFSDDEEERLHKNKSSRDNPGGDNPDSKEPNKSRKRSFRKTNQNSGVLQGNRFRNPSFTQHRANFQRSPSGNQFGTPPPPFPRPNFPNPHQMSQFPYNVPPYTFPPHFLYPPRFSGPPFPSFQGLPHLGQNPNFQQPFYQQRTNPFLHGFGAWPPPPPPLPSSEQGGRSSTSDAERPLP